MSVNYGLITESSTGDIYNIDFGSITEGTNPDTTKPFRNIRVALETRFNALAGALGITNKVFENIDFDIGSVAKASTSTEWIRGTLLPAETVASSLSTTGLDNQNGIFQIDYYNRTGIGGYTDRLDSIANYFARGDKYTANGTVVRIRNVSLGVGRRDGAFFVRNVDVSYFATTPVRS